MKAFRREQLIDVIKHTFAYGEIVFETDLQDMMKKYGEDYFVEDGKWKHIDDCKY